MSLWAAVKRRLTKPPSDPGVINTAAQLYAAAMAPEPIGSKTPLLECEICHKEVADKRDVVCVHDGIDGGLQGFGHNLSFGEPHTRYEKVVCSSKCAHALLDQHIVIWRLSGLFGAQPEDEIDDY
jgi:hypothetical protein